LSYRADLDNIAVAIAIAIAIAIWLSLDTIEE